MTDERAISRRTRRRDKDTPLSGFALDVTVRVNDRGKWFLHDRNVPKEPAMLFDTVTELTAFLTDELDRHRDEFFELDYDE